MAPKVDLAASWAPFGQGLGRSWGSFGSSWALPGRFFGVWKRPLIKHWSTMGSKRPSSSILEPPGLNFGASGPQFWSFQATLVERKGFFLASRGFVCFLNRFGRFFRSAHVSFNCVTAPQHSRPRWNPARTSF